MPRKINLKKGDRFGRWTIIEESPRRFTRNGNKRQREFICRCDCGTHKAVLLASLTNGRSLSCGCLHDELVAEQNYKHGLPHDKFYALWSNIKIRCYNPDCEDYIYYGARGIRMYNEWINDPLAFVTYVKSLDNSDNEKLSIDRINTNGNYEPNNLRWATSEIQARNQRLKGNNKTGYAGVCYNKRIDKFVATIRADGKSKVLARTTSIEEAHEIRRMFILDNKLEGYNPDI